MTKLKHKVAKMNKRSRLAKPDYMGEFGECFCKKCGEALTKLVPTGRKGPGGVDLAVIMPSDGYRAVTILFDDGSKHQTPLHECVIKDLTIEDLEDIYTADLQEFESKGMDIIDQWLKRKPVKVDKVERL